jgi:uncharacterized protein
VIETLLALLQEPQTWVFVGIGFVAQLFDGAIGMGFGAISSTVLGALGLPREVASASVNGAKILTGAASGIGHVALRNVDWRMLAVLASAGMLGGLLGSLLLTRHSGPLLGVFVSAYLVVVGIVIIRRAFGAAPPRVPHAKIGGVGLAGGFLEAMSGVWGPLVTSNLVAVGANPRYVVGTGSIAETFVAAVVFTVLVRHLGFEQLSVATIGLIVGALLATPIAARITRSLPRKPLMISVGVLVILLSLVRLGRDLSVVAVS